MKRYDGMSLSELLALINDETEALETRDEALYYILTERLSAKMRRRFEIYKGRLHEGFEDELQDYFLYLRGDVDEPYKVLKTIRNSSSFGAWLVKAFSNFLHKKSTEGEPSPRCVPEKYLPAACDGSSAERTFEEGYIRMLSLLVAYCYQEFGPMSRFIFLRMLLTQLEKDRALATNEIADALGMTDTYYRVINYRIKCKILRIKEMLLSGAQLPLTPESRLLAEKLGENFSNWYQRLLECYDDTLASLAQSAEIGSLRRRHLPESGGLLHDSAVATYGRKKVGTFRE